MSLIFPERHQIPVKDEEKPFLSLDSLKYFNYEGPCFPRAVLKTLGIRCSLHFWTGWVTCPEAFTNRNKREISPAAEPQVDTRRQLPSQVAAHLILRKGKDFNKRREVRVCEGSEWEKVVVHQRSEHNNSQFQYTDFNSNPDSIALGGKSRGF